MDECSWLESELNKRLIGNSIKQILDIKLESAVPPGENYLSEIKRATLNIVYENGFKCKKTLIYKIKEIEEDKAKAMEDFPVFKAEIYVYEQVLLKLEQLMDEYQDYNDKLWCNLIAYKPYNLIIFEDLKALNYKLADRKKLLDLNHTLLVMHSLGRFHALGHVLLKKGLFTKDNFGLHYFQSDSPTINNLTAGGLHQFANVIKKDWEPEWQEVATRLNKQEEVVMERLRSAFTIEDDTFTTICHGDSWTCNMLFKYCPYDETIPIAVKFVDYQNTFVNSGIIDVSTFLFTSVRPHIRRIDFNKFLSVYQKSLKETLAIYGMEEYAPTLEHIYAEAERTLYFSFIACTTGLPVTCASNVAMDFEKLNFDYRENNVFHREIFNTEIFKEGIKEDLKYWKDIGLF